MIFKLESFFEYPGQLSPLCIKLPTLSASPTQMKDISSSLTDNIVRRTIGKTTYVASLHFKEHGQTFSQKLRRVLKAECQLKAK